MSRSVCRRIARYDATRIGAKYCARALAHVVARAPAGAGPAIERRAARLSPRARAAFFAQLAALGAI